VHVQGGAHRVVLRDLLVHHAGDDGDGIKVNQAHDIVIERVECHHPWRRPGQPSGNPAQECIDLVDAQRIVVQDSYLHDGGNMLMYAKGGSRDVVFQRNVIVGQEEGAIDPCVGLGAWTDRELLRGREYEAEDVVFRNNVVVRCRAGALGVYDARRVWIVNNTLVDNGPAAIEFRAGNAPREESRDVHVVNNVVADTAGGLEAAIVRHSHEVTELEVMHNLYWNGGREVPAAGLVDPHAEPGGVMADPVLVPLAGEGSARVRAARSVALDGRSAAIDRGLALQGPGRVTDDLLGWRRPHGRGVDLGSIEFGATEPAAFSGIREPWPSESASVEPATPRRPAHTGPARGGGPARAGCVRGCSNGGRSRRTAVATAALAAALSASTGRRR
jgi:hypothetical protein